MKLSSSNAVNHSAPVRGVILVAVATAFAVSAAVAQDKVWPESKIKIDPADVRHQVVTKLNIKSKGTYTVSENPPAGFPVPLPSGVENATFTSNSGMMAGTMKTRDVPASVIKWYRPIVEEKGFKIIDHPKSAAEDSGRASIITASRDDGNVTVNLNISCITPKPSYSILSIMSMQVQKGSAKK